MGRVELHAKLIDILGTEKVYFQPPNNYKVGHPCIVYELTKKDSKFANNQIYKSMTRYAVTLIHSNPDNNIIEEMLRLPFTSLDRFYTADTLNHYVYTVYHK